MVAKKRNPKQQAIGQASWKRAQEKKALGILEQQERKEINDVFRKDGERTPYQQRKHDKFLARIAGKHGQATIDSVE